MMPRMEQTERLVDVGDTRLFVAERGDGFPVIVLHGGPGLDHTQFGAYLDPLADRYRLVLVDQRSQGRSDTAPRETWSIERMAADVTALADALGYGPYAVLGHSFGAFVALRHAVDFTGHPCGTLVSSGLPSTKYMADIAANVAAFEPADLREQVQASWDAEPNVESADELKALLNDQWPWHFADPRDPRIATYAAELDAMVVTPDVLKHFSSEEYGGLDVVDRLGEVEHPVLVLAGRHDRTCTVEAAEVIANGIPGAELAVFEHSGHMTYVEEQARYLEVARDFLDRVRR
jgi:proline iminopeptidase